MPARLRVNCALYLLLVVLTGCFVGEPSTFLDGTVAPSPTEDPTDGPTAKPSESPDDSPTPSLTPSLPPPTPSVAPDEDGDGVPNGLDCAPNDPSSYPDAEEKCDGIDNDCDSNIDDGLPLFTFYLDQDGDGVGGTSTIAACIQPEGTATVSSDCNENDAAVFPEAEELCDGKDNNCDGTADETLGIYCPDKDGDGFGEAGEACVENCGETDGTVRNDTDCLDSNSNVYPGAMELCDGTDQDCQDEPEVSELYYPDLDGDGFGNDSEGTVELCAPHPQFSLVGRDCDDTTALLHPHLVDGEMGSAEGDGTLYFPFDSIPLALSAGDDCGLILVAEGAYAEPVQITDRQMPLSMEPFELHGRIELSTPGNLAMSIAGSKFVTLKGFDFKCTSARSADGGAVQLLNSSDIVLDDVSITSCVAKNANGGGLYSTLSYNVMIKDSRFSDNKAGVGGAIALRGGSLWVSNSVFANNRAESAAGGALEARESSSKVPAQLYIDGSEFTKNSASKYGGALSSENDTVMEVRDSYFEGNQADEQYGGAINSPSLVLRSTFVKNRCPGANNYADGAAVMLRQSARLANSIFMGNTAYYAGGVDIFELETDTAHLIEQNTFVDNDSSASLSLGDTFYIFVADKVTFRNNIVVDLDGGNGNAIYNLDTDLSWTISYNFIYVSSGSAVGSGFSGVNNNSVMGQNGNFGEDIRSKPFFTLYEVGKYDTADLHLVSEASAVDAGDPNAASDLDGTRADMGAYGGPDALP